jgi:hypothetical protein
VEVTEKQIALLKNYDYKTPQNNKDVNFQEQLMTILEKKDLSAESAHKKLTRDEIQ